MEIDNLECGICMCILDKPVLLISSGELSFSDNSHCTHSFCKKCVDELIKTTYKTKKTPKCPICRRDIIACRNNIILETAILKANENNSTRTNNIRLIEENKKLYEEVANILREKIKLEYIQQQYINEHTSLLNKHSILSNEHTILSNEHSSLLNEHTNLLNGHAILSNEYTSLLNEHSSLLNEHKTLTNNNIILLNENTILFNEIKNLKNANHNTHNTNHNTHNTNHNTHNTNHNTHNTNHNTHNTNHNTTKNVKEITKINKKELLDPKNNFNIFKTITTKLTCVNSSIIDKYNKFCIKELSKDTYLPKISFNTNVSIFNYFNSQKRPILNKDECFEYNKYIHYREAYNLYHLSHPNIISLMNIMEDAILIPYIEYTLNNLINSKMSICYNCNILPIFAKISNAIAYLHENDIAHLNINTNSILFNSSNMKTSILYDGTIFNHYNRCMCNCNMPGSTEIIYSIEPILCSFTYSRKVIKQGGINIPCVLSIPIKSMSPELLYMAINSKSYYENETTDFIPNNINQWNLNPCSIDVFQFGSTLLNVFLLQNIFTANDYIECLKRILNVEELSKSIPQMYNGYKKYNNGCKFMLKDKFKEIKKEICSRLCKNYENKENECNSCIICEFIYKICLLTMDINHNNRPTIKYINELITNITHTSFNNEYIKKENFDTFDIWISKFI